ncbi:MAG: gliding motility-associated C-terminal domain-containing protein [Flavobacteriales bacterium]|nr:gliding motility-associated C-terminal domain-containing protein [Flavobacteriales bacterium]
MKRWYQVRFLFVLVVSLLAGQASAVILDAPVLHCASVNLVGDVTVTWTPPADPGGDFQEYQLYHCVNGVCTLQTVIPVYGTTSYYHPGAGADAGPQCYYITAVSTSPPPNTSVPSDTLCTIFLSVGQSAPLGSAVLDWTPQHTPPIPSAGANYGIWMEYPQGTWSQVASVANTVLHYEHVIDICGDSLTFRVGLVDALGCVSFSNLAGDQFTDAAPPSVPVVPTVSVDSLTCLTTVTWAPSPEPDTDGYIMVLVTTGGNVVVDTVWGGTSTTFIWPGSDPCSGSESWVVAAFDTCYSGNPNPSPNTSATGEPHTTVYATNAYDACEAEITISWTQYEGWDVASYELHAQVDGGPWYLLSIHGTNEFSTVHTGVDPFKTYCYVVKARESGGIRTSLSNKTCVTTSYPGLPAFNYLSNVTVVVENEVMITDEVDMSAEVKRYHLARSQNGLPFAVVQSVAGNIGPTISFTDTDVETSARSYRYRIIVEDSCGTITLTSNEGNTIHLTAEAGLDGINKLRWNGYVGWAGVPSGFNIYRSIAGGPFSLLATNPASQAELLDDVSALYETNGNFCYYVECLESGNPGGVDAVSVSNVACAVQQEQFWVPNAFIAGGYNDSFIPVTAYTDITGYELTIFNRWGQPIWTTSDRFEAWDGRMEGNYVPQGVYGWYCTFRNGSGRQFTDRGTVTFLYGVE